MPNIDEAIEALLSYQQADMEGVMVLTSRQAIHEVADELKRVRSHAQDENASIEALEAEVDRLRRELSDAQTRLTDAKIAICGVAIGDIVIRKGKRYRVTEIDVHWTHSLPWLKGVQQLKDGSWGIADRNLYNEWVKELQEVEP